MSLISSDDLSYMRDYAESWMPDTCQIEDFARVSDGAGGFTESWSAVGTVACRIDPTQTTEQDVKISGKDTLRSVYLISLPYDCGLTDEHRIVCGGDIYQVLQMDNAHSGKISIRARIARYD